MDRNPQLPEWASGVEGQTAPACAGRAVDRVRGMQLLQEAADGQAIRAPLADQEANRR